ncbi:MAG: hypothetical protein MI743_20985 [Sneathiellales bacterium]|nr:hypothetical protein [Sneathiellales bacterium]
MSDKKKEASSNLDSKSEVDFTKAPYDDKKYIVKEDGEDWVKSGKKLADEGDALYPKQYYANPYYAEDGVFNPKDLALFFPKKWWGEYPVNEVKNLHGYREKLVNVAIKFLTNPDIEHMLSGKSPIHPFLEVGGALRVQVPLPDTVEEFYILTSAVLDKENENNFDQWQFPEQGFSVEKDNLPETAFPFLLSQQEKNQEAARDAKLTNLNNGEKREISRHLLLWDDMAGAKGINKTNCCPNLLKLLCSIIYQKCDMLAYGGSRGRYGPAVVRRLIDGFAYRPKLAEGEAPKRVLTAFAFDQTGMPYGFYSGVVLIPKSKLELPPKLGPVEVRIPALLLNYTFVADDQSRSAGKTTGLLVDFMLAYTANYVTGLPPLYHMLTIHTDKCMAAKSAEKLMDNKTSDKSARSLYNSVATDVWKTINNNNRYHFDYPECLKFTSLMQVDQSTVPYMDEGEEVPMPEDRFYKAIYPGYVKLIEDNCGDENNKYEISEELKHGCLNADDSDLAAIAKKYGIEVHEILKALKADASLVYRDHLSNNLSNPVLEGTELRIHNLFRVNKADAFDDLKLAISPNTGWQNTERKNEFLKALFKVLRNAAKKGNTANEYHYERNEVNKNDQNVKIPRLTDFGFILVGDVKLGLNVSVQSKQQELKEFITDDVSNVITRDILSDGDGDYLSINGKPETLPPAIGDRNYSDAILQTIKVVQN